MKFYAFCYKNEFKSVKFKNEACLTFQSEYEHLLKFVDRCILTTGDNPTCFYI